MSYAEGQDLSHLKKEQLVISPLLKIVLLNIAMSRHLKEYSTVHELRDTSVPRKHRAAYRDRGNWGTTKTRNVH